MNEEGENDLVQRAIKLELTQRAQRAVAVRWAKPGARKAMSKIMKGYWDCIKAENGQSEYVPSEYVTFIPREVRTEVLARAAGACEECNKIVSGLYLHHLRYSYYDPIKKRHIDIRGHETSNDLKAMCASCHASCHRADFSAALKLAHAKLRAARRKAERQAAKAAAS
jgi:hypothetical protein